MANKRIIEKLINQIKYEYNDKQLKNYKKDLKVIDKTLEKQVKDTKKRINKINKEKIKPKVDTSRIEKLKKVLDKTKLSLIGLKNIAGKGLKIGAIGGTIGAGVGIAAGIGMANWMKESNEAVLQQKALGNAVGGNISLIRAFGNAIKPLGMTYENVSDLMEEMNNKFGENNALLQRGEKPLSSVTDSMKTLGLNYKELQKYNPAQQFLIIMEKAKRLKDKQKAVSAVDMLFGGEATKILGYIRTYKKSLIDILIEYKKLDFLTKKGVKGAEDFTKTWTKVSIVLESVKEQIFGLAGETLAPYLKQITDWVSSPAGKVWIEGKIKSGITIFRDAIEGLQEADWGQIKESLKEAYIGFKDLIKSGPSIKNTFKGIGKSLESVSKSLKEMITYLRGVKILYNTFFGPKKDIDLKTKLEKKGISKEILEKTGIKFDIKKAKEKGLTKQQINDKSYMELFTVFKNLVSKYKKEIPSEELQDFKDFINKQEEKMKFVMPEGRDAKELIIEFEKLKDIINSEKEKPTASNIINIYTSQDPDEIVNAINRQIALQNAGYALG